MYAIVETGGKQYRVEPGSILHIEQLPGDVGGTIELSQVRFGSEIRCRPSHRSSVGRTRWSHSQEIVRQGRTRSL